MIVQGIDSLVLLMKNGKFITLDSSEITVQVHKTEIPQDGTDACIPVEYYVITTTPIERVT